MPTNTILPIIISNGHLVDSSIEGNLLSVLETTWNLVKENLRNFAQSPRFFTKMELAFGVGINSTDLQQAWLAGQFALPSIEIRPKTDLNAALWGVCDRDWQDLLGTGVIEKLCFGSFSFSFIKRIRLLD